MAVAAGAALTVVAALAGLLVQAVLVVLQHPAVAAALAAVVMWAPASVGLVMLILLR